MKACCTGDFEMIDRLRVLLITVDIAYYLTTLGITVFQAWLGSSVSWSDIASIAIYTGEKLFQLS